MQKLLSSVDQEVLVVLGILGLGYLFTALVFRCLVRRKIMTGKGAGFIKWLFLLLFLLSVDWLLLPRLDHAGSLATLVFILELGTLWFLLKEFLDGFYVDVYLRRIKKQQVNHILVDLVKILVFAAIAVWAVKRIFDINPGSILTSSVILTAVVGFAMQDTIGSLMSGLLIQLEKPFSIGEWISVAGLEGRVVEITWRYTKIETISRDYVLVPNNSISRDTLINFNRPITEVRREARFSVALDTPPVKVKTALNEVIKKCPSILPYPAPKIRLAGYLDYRAEYLVIFYVRNFDHARRAVDELNTSVWYQFRSQDIVIPMPRQDIYLRRPDRAESVDHIIQSLQNTTLFEGMAPKDLEMLVRSASRRVYPPQSRIVSAGDTDRTMFIVIQGRVRVMQREKEIAVIESGTVFGEMALLTGEPRTADVDALEPTHCLVIDQEGFRMLLEKNPAIIANIRRIFEQRRENLMEHGIAPGAGHGEPGTLFQMFKRIFLN